MTLRFQRLVFILFTFILFISAVFLILFNTKNNIIFFYTPSELIEKNPSLNQIVRVGAFVEEGSFKKISLDTYNFNITDNKKSVKITYQGFLPDLFKEGKGAVVEGILIKKNYIKANSVFAKHDENYMPSSLKKELINNQYWQKNYK